MTKHLHCQSKAKKLENSDISVHLIQSLQNTPVWEKNAISFFLFIWLHLMGAMDKHATLTELAWAGPTKVSNPERTIFNLSL